MAADFPPMTPEDIATARADIGYLSRRALRLLRAVEHHDQAGVLGAFDGLDDQALAGLSIQLVQIARGVIADAPFTVDQVCDRVEANLQRGGL